MATNPSPLSNIIWLTTEKLISVAINFAVTLLIARHLGATQFGELSFLLAIVAVMAPFMALGMNALITRELVQSPKHTHIILGSALLIRLCGAVLISLCVFAASSYLVPPHLTSGLTILLCANLFTAFGMFDFWLQAHLANRLAARARLTVLVLMGACKLAAIAYHAPLEWFIWLSAAEIVLLGMAFLMLYHLVGEGLAQLTPRLSKAKTLLYKARWLILSGVAAVIYLKVDQIMLGMLSGPQAVGVYAVAAKLSEVWYFFPAAVVTSFFPKLLKEKATSHALYHTRLQQLTDFLFITAFIIAVLTSLLAVYVVPLLFGVQYQASVNVLEVHIWGGIFIAMRQLLSKWLLAEDILQFSLITQLAGALTNVVLNLILIPRYGAIGAAYATVFSYMVASWLALWWHPKTSGMAKMMLTAMLLPIRLLRRGRNLYR